MTIPNTVKKRTVIIPRTSNLLEGFFIKNAPFNNLIQRTRRKKSEKRKILVVDDDPAIRRLIWKSLQSTGILIYQSDSVEKTVDIMTRVKFDLFLLDISLEHENDGYYLAQIIREEDPLVPIIFLSGKKKEDIITGLEMGGDYYITKPFLPNLLRAQVTVTLDRGQVIKEHRALSKESKIMIGDFCFDKSRYQLYKKEEPIKLSSKETKLMQFL